MSKRQLKADIRPHKRSLSRKEGETVKEFIVYQRGRTRVYIHKGRREKGHKLCWYGIRRDDSTGLCALLGIIKFSGRWRQYVTEFEPDTVWSSGCKKRICEFEDLLNARWKKKVRR